MRRAQLLRQLVLDSQYVIDEHLVAAAILARAATRRVLADATFRNDLRAPRVVRSFRPTSQVRSFRPYVLRSAGERRRSHGLAEPA
jgi:hypothetical protein